MALACFEPGPEYLPESMENVSGCARRQIACRRGKTHRGTGSREHPPLISPGELGMGEEGRRPADAMPSSRCLVEAAADRSVSHQSAPRTFVEGDGCRRRKGCGVRSRLVRRTSRVLDYQKLRLANSRPSNRDRVQTLGRRYIERQVRLMLCHLPPTSTAAHSTQARVLCRGKGPLSTSRSKCSGSLHKYPLYSRRGADILPPPHSGGQQVGD